MKTLAKIFLAIFITLSSGCNPEPGSIDGKQCSANDECVDGWYCDTATSIKTCVTVGSLCAEPDRTIPCGSGLAMTCSSELSWGECISNPCEGINCSDHGTCVVGTCSCEADWSGSDCSIPADLCVEVTCDSGYECRPSDGQCVLIGDKCDPDPCNPNGGVCDSSDGSCNCSTGYIGLTCDVCDAGYVPGPDNTTCIPSPCIGNDCNGNGTCEVNLGLASCACNTGWNPLDDCASCASGYHVEGPNCVVDTACVVNSCNGNGTCDDSSGVVVCSCDPEYTGASCSQCASGYQDNDSNGICEANCATANPNCSGNGSCSDTSGTAVCSCDPEYTGSSCEQCQVGYYYWPTCSPFLSTVSATLSSGQTTEMNFGNGGYSLLNHTLEADSTGNTAIVRLAYRVQLSGVQATSFILFRNDSIQLTGGGSPVAQLTAITVTPDQEIIVVVAFFTEEPVDQNTSQKYTLSATMNGVDTTGDSVTVTLLTDDTPTSTLNGEHLGYVWNSTVSEDMLFTDQLGMNQNGAPWFVWSGMKDAVGYAYPSIGSGGNILTSGSPHFSDSYEIRSQLSGIQNTATKTN